MARTIISGSVVQAASAPLQGRTNTPINTEGVVESVEDVIALISPYETPFFSQLEKVPVNDVRHYWMEDELRAPVRNNAKILGWEPQSGEYAGSTPGMKQNFTQLFTETARVSESMRRVDTYGRGDELDYQVMKRGREIRRDVEASLLAQQNGTAPVNSTAFNATFPNIPTTSAVAAIMAGACNLIDAGNQSVGGGAGAIGGVAGDGATQITYTAGTARAFTETLLLAAQKLAYDAGGDPTQVILVPALAQKMATFAYIDPTAGVASRTREISGTDDQSVLVNAVDIYKSPYGTLAVVIDRFAVGGLSGETADATALIVDPGMWAVGTLRPMQSEPLAKTGDNSKALLTAEYTLIHRNTKASAAIRNLNPAL